MLTIEQIAEILARYPEKKPTVLSYAIVREDIAQLSAAAERAAQGAEGVFPCKPGDTIFFIDRVDCFECPRVNYCAGAEIKPVRSKSERVGFDYGSCPFEVVECEVDSAEFIYDEDGLYFLVNDSIEFIEPRETIRFTYEDAEADLSALERGNKNVDA